ncbi:hypothetical protein VNO77_19274 [Canavalia gladiata]|uniref:Secreted protein n=1 Tax=Canavalia gladiata TaxID=3824 RepID=A0AAN9LMD2_CANGL
MISHFCECFILGILLVALVRPSEPVTPLLDDFLGYNCTGDYKSADACRPNCTDKGCFCIGEVSDFDVSGSL